MLIATVAASDTAGALAAPTQLATPFSECSVHVPQSRVSTQLASPHRGHAVLHTPAHSPGVLEGLPVGALSDLGDALQLRLAAHQLLHAGDTAQVGLRQERAEDYLGTLDLPLA